MMNIDVREVINSYPPAARKHVRALRKLILATARATAGVGEITETLKWGEPAYLTERSRSGSTIRIAWKASSAEVCGVYLNCQTTLIDTCRTLFPELQIEGNRAIILPLDRPLPLDAMRICFTAALTYHSTRRAARRSTRSVAKRRSTGG